MKIIKKYYNQIISIFIVLSFIFSIDNFIHIKNITSLINPNDIISLDEYVLCSTNGGAFLYNIYTNQINTLVDVLEYQNIQTVSKDQYGRLWIGGNNPDGVVQILNSEFTLEHLLDYANFDHIEQIVFSTNFAFALSFYQGKYGIIKYSNNESPSYLNFFDEFPYENIVINDLSVYNDTLIVASDKGLLKGYSNNNFLLFSNEWIESYNDMNILDIIIDASDVYIVADNQIIKNDEVVADYQNQDFIIESSLSYSNEIYYLTKSNLYRLDNENVLSDIFEIPLEFKCISPCSDQYGFSDFEVINDHFYFTIKNNGILITDNNFNIIDNIIPNSLFKNSFNSIKYNDLNNSLYGISKEGGFVINNPTSINGNEYIKNFYPINFDSDDENVLTNEYYGKYPEHTLSSNSRFYGKYIKYISGEKDPLSIDFDFEGNIFIPNSGVYPSINQGHYNSIIDSVLNQGHSVNDISLGSLYKIDVNNFEITYDWGDEVFNGLGGITSNNSNGYTVINQIKFISEDLYVLNPYSENWYNDNLENINLPICIKSKEDNWSFIQDNENIEAYIPTEIAIDPLNNIWIGYRSFQDHSPGGVRLIQSSNNNLWYNVGLIPELSGVNVWSLDFGLDINNNYMLWVVSDLGVMGYYVNMNTTQNNILDIEIININPYYYYSDIPFDISSKVRLDKQNNAWITTPGHGLKIIKSNGQLWPVNNGITTSNSKLLSNYVYDISFDDNGYVYISTDKGISIIKTVFNLGDFSNNISISPNPFIIGEDTDITLSNFPDKSLIQIMTLNGDVVKEFKLVYENSILNWDGIGSNGKILKTGIYLVAAYNGDKSTIGKLAIIN